jgi:hypothetical protein
MGGIVNNFNIFAIVITISLTASWLHDIVLTSIKLKGDDGNE